MTEKQTAISFALAAAAFSVIVSLPGAFIAAKNAKDVTEMGTTIATLQTRLDIVESLLKGRMGEQQAGDDGCCQQPQPSDFYAGSLEDVTMFAGPENAPVAIFYGDVVITGTVTVADLFTAEGSLVTAQKRDAFYVADRCIDIPCVNGLQRAFSDCTCVCDNHWSGLGCTVHDCYGHGTWIASVNAMHGYCACVGDYISDYMCEFVNCRGMITTECPDLPSIGCNSHAVIGNNCSLECLKPGPCDARANWGTPHYPTNTHPFGLCGAGYQGNALMMSPDDLVATVGGMTCANSNISACIQQFEREAPICCRLSVQNTSIISMADCSSSAVPSPLECAEYQDLETCTGQGCAWCSNRICMSTIAADISIDCIAPEPRSFDIYGTWMYASYPCTGSTCPPVVIQRAADIWTTGGDDAFAIITETPWPELSPFPFSGSGSIAIRMTYGSVTGWLGTMRYQLRLASTPQTWFVAYPPNTWEPTPWLLEGTPLQLMTISYGVKEMMCLASSRLNSLIQLQMFGTINTPLSALVPVTTSACGTYRFDTPVLYDEEGDYGMTIDVNWASNSSVAAIEIVPL